MNLGQLPVEIISLIVKHLDEDDYYECALVNKLFYTTTNPVLWETPNLSNELYFNNIITTMLSYQQDDLARHVRHVEIGFPMTDAYFLLFMKLVPQVEKLAVQQGMLTDTALELLARYCPHLKCIHIQDSDITEKSILTMAQHYPQLEGLHLVECASVSPRSGCFSALSACTFLEELCLEVGVMKGLEDDEYEASEYDERAMKRLVLDLTTLQHLKRLTLLECPTPFSQHLLAAAAATPTIWPHLTLFNLERCIDINNKVAIEFIKTHPHLEQLTLRQSNQFTDSVLRAIVKHLPNIRALDMLYSTSITATGVRRVICKCPQLMFLNLGKCRIKADAFKHVDLDEYLDEDEILEDTSMEWNDDGEPMHLLYLDKSAIDKIRLDG